MSTKYLDKTGLTYFWGKLKNYFQVKLVSGTNIKTINNQSLLGSGNISISGGGGGSSDYTDLTNKPQINSVELSGNKSLSDLGIPTKTSDLTNDSGFINASSRLSGLYKIITVDITVGSISAHGNQAAQNYSFENDLPDGYRVVGVVGYISSNYRIRATTYYITDATKTVYIGFCNTSASSVSSGTTVSLKLLCLHTSALS